MIDTSEIRIRCVLPEDAGIVALLTAHQAFKLNGGQKIEVMGTESPYPSN